MQSCSLALFRTEDARPFTNPIAVAHAETQSKCAYEDVKKTYGNQEHTTKRSVIFVFEDRIWRAESGKRKANNEEYAEPDYFLGTALTLYLHSGTSLFELGGRAI